ncbi:MAG TPA: choice-of-anchor J domain-containing protein, partial [Chitinophaga sp.]
LNVKLSPHTAYAITLDSNAVQDISGNAFAGLTDHSWTFTTGAQVTSIDFNDCTPAGSTSLSGGFTQYAVTGAQKWGCSTFGENGSNGVEINGYSSGPQTNEQWLISPAFDLRAYHYPLLNFSSRVAFTGPALQLMVSTNYDGVSHPHTATWTPLNGRFPGADQADWQASAGINLAAFKDSSVYVAFLYVSSPSRNAARWDIDNFSIVNSATPPPPSVSNTISSLAFDYVKAGSISAPQAFTFYGNDFTGPLTVSAPAGFKISKDSIHYASSITYTLAEVNEGQHTGFVEFAPAAANTNYADSLTFTSPGYRQRLTGLSGTSLHSLKVVNWNMEWFGSTEQDPANDSLQQANATVVLQNLNADIFALVEVVDTARIHAVANQLGYNMVISDFGSYADSISDPDYASAQKLAFLYKPGVIRGIRSYGVLRYNASPDAYKNWSSGRFPFYFETEAQLDGDSARIGFFVLHGKANTGSAADKIDAYNRRLNGNREFKDSLDAEFRHTNFLILGDYNDALNKTITTELAPDTTTSYIDFMNDSVNYKPLTLPLALAGKKSTVSNANVIDNVIASAEMAMAYLPNSAQVADGVARLVSSYGTTTSDHYPVMSRYDLHVLATPAPVTDFRAKDHNGAIDLTWNTSYEINTNYFVVERSGNGRNFSPADTVTAQGTTPLPSAYSTQDKHPLPGTSYYRLKTVSRDSSFTYSEVRSVTLTLKESIFQLLWCLLGHQLQIWIDWHQKGVANGNLQLIDLFGRVRYNGAVTLVEGRNSTLLDVNNIPSGIYFLRVQTNTQVQTSTIVIAR